MKRRAYLASVASAATLVAGCTASASEHYQGIVDPDPSVSQTGLAPDPVEVPSREVDESQLETYVATNDASTTVRMVPLDIAYYWYNTRKARFIDARTAQQYEEHHIKGAEFSPAPHGGDDDPVTDWGENERIIVYCTCPHHLSGIRAGNLLEDGFTGAYVLGPGMKPWAENDYPTGGSVKTKTEFVDDYSNVEDSEEE